MPKPKTAARAASSTEPPAEPSAPRAWPFAQALPDLVAAFARRAGLGEGPGASAAVSAHLDHRDRIRGTLRGLPALEIVLLEILAELGGRVTTEEVVHFARARTGCAAPVVTAALQGLHVALLTVSLTTNPPRGERIPVVALLTPSAEHVARLVRGVSLPPSEPPPEAKPTALDSATRELVAVTALTAHRPLRYNLDGAPNGGQIARFGKGLALPDAAVERLLLGARKLGLLGAVGDVYAPVAAALRRFAAGIDEELDAWLPAASWASVEAVARASLRWTIEPHHTHTPLDLTRPLFEMLEAAVARVKSARGAEVVEAGGHAWIRRRSAGPSGGGDGHVTPSFEVMLGPRADPDIVAVVSLGCELVRLDRVLTYRITPASVAAGSSCGLAAKDLLGALDRVGRHPLPANVRTMVEEWIAGRRAATIARAWVVCVPEVVADALAQGDLAASIVDRPAPGVLAIDPSVRRGELVKHLGKQRVSLGPPIPLAEAIANRDDDRWGRGHRERVEENPRALPRPLPLPLTFEGNPALAEKVATARTAGFVPAASLPAQVTSPPTRPAPMPPARPVPAPSPAPRPAVAPPAPQAVPVPPAPVAEPPPGARVTLPVDAMLDEARALGLAPDLLRGLASLGAMYVELLPELERWVTRLPPAARIPAQKVLDSPLALRSFLVLAPKARLTVLGKANDVDRLVQESLRSRELCRTSPRGAAALPLLAEVERALATRPAAGGQDPKGASIPADFKRRPEAEVLAALQTACAKAQVVRIVVRSGAGTAVHTVIASAVQPRGTTSAFLAIDPETDEGRVFHVPDVLGVLPGSK